MNITLANLHLATKQQVFDKVAIHLLTQNVKSHDYYEQCLYRTEEGLMCAAGCLIAEDEYVPRQMEGSNWSSNVFPDAHRELIRELQQVHDLHDVEFWPKSLMVVADEHGLDNTALFKFK